MTHFQTDQTKLPSGINKVFSYLNKHISQYIETYQQTQIEIQGIKRESGICHKNT